MQHEGDILEQLRAQSAEAVRRSYRALIIQPGAIGDCLLTLPLVNFMKESLRLGRVDMLSHTEYTGILPGRTSLDAVISIDALDMHKLYAEPDKFNPADGDPLIHAFAGYSWIITFLGDSGSHFEQNLIFTANCLHTTEVVTLSLKPQQNSSEHISDYYIRQFVQLGNLSQEPVNLNPSCSITPAKTDILKGKQLIKDSGLDVGRNLIVLHPGSGSKNKCWHLDNFLAVAEKLHCGNCQVAFILGPAEMERFDKSQVKKLKNFAPCFTDLALGDVLNILSCAYGFIGNDSGVTHLAGMLGVRTLVIFGPTSPDVYKPIGPNVAIIQNKSASFANHPSIRSQQKVLDAFMAIGNL
jgi:heptosyltransferase III